MAAAVAGEEDELDPEESKWKIPFAIKMGMSDDKCFGGALHTTWSGSGFFKILGRAFFTRRQSCSLKFSRISYQWFEGRSA